jgi:hypothetical protein
MLELLQIKQMLSSAEFHQSAIAQNNFRSIVKFFLGFRRQNWGSCLGNTERETAEATGDPSASGGR